MCRQVAKLARACRQLSQNITQTSWTAARNVLASLSWFDELTMRACGDCSEAFELAEEALDEVAFAIEGEIGFAFDESIGFGWNDGCDATFFQGLDQGVCIIGLVCEKGFRLDLFEQRCGSGWVGCLAGRERHGNGIAESGHDQRYARKRRSHTTIAS